MAMVEKIKNKLRGNGFLLAVTIVLFFVLYIAGAILYGDRNFTSPQVFLNLFISNAGLIIAAVGMTFVLITGGIDISIGSVIGVVCMMLAWMMEVKHMSAVVAIILVLAFGVIFGLVQGFLVAYLKIQPFIVTLGGMFFARGLTALISSDMISIENPTFLSLANYRIYFGFITYYNNRGVAMHPYIYLSVVIALLVVAISFVILRYTKFGRAVFAVGGNEQSALLMGLNPKVTKLKVYVLNGFLASLAGFAFCLNSCGGFVEQARGFEMDAIAAAVIGGTLLTGGVGTVVGSLFGSLIKGIIETIITFQGTLEDDIAPGDITFFRLQSTADTKLRAYVAQGEILPVATRSFGSIGVFAIPEMGRFYRHVLIEKNFPHHGAVAFGHFGKTLYEVFKYIGVDVDEIGFNQPKNMLYKTENPFS